MGKAEDVYFARQQAARAQAMPKNQARARQCFSQIERLLSQIPELSEHTNYDHVRPCWREPDGWKVGYTIGERGASDTAGDGTDITEIHVLADGRLFINYMDFYNPERREILAAHHPDSVETALSQLKNLVARLQDQAARRPRRRAH